MQIVAGYMFHVREISDYSATLCIMLTIKQFIYVEKNAMQVPG